MTTMLGERLRALREADGLTMKEVARRCGINLGTLCRIETGKHEPTLAVFAALARTYCLTMDELYEDVTPRRPNRRRRAVAGSRMEVAR